MSRVREKSATFTQYIIQRTKAAIAARNPKMGMMQQQALMHMANPSDWPGAGSATKAIPRPVELVAKGFGHRKNNEKMKNEANQRNDVEPNHPGLHRA
jgi:hypothetical protein